MSRKQVLGNHCVYSQIYWLLNLKYIIDAVILSNLKGVTDNNPNVHMTSTHVKKPSARKSLCLFTNILDVQPKTAKRRFVAEES